MKCRTLLGILLLLMGLQSFLDLFTKDAPWSIVVGITGLCLVSLGVWYLTDERTCR